MAVNWISRSAEADSSSKTIRLYRQISGLGPPLLLLHGLGSSSQDWEMQVPFFEKHFTVIAPDLRGHGRSPKPEGKYTIPMMARDVAALMDSLDAEPVDLVGVSMGGMVGLQLALDYPGKVRRMVLANTCAEILVHTFGEWLQLWQRRFALGLLGMRGVGALLAPRLFPYEHQAEIRRVFKKRWRQNDRRAYRKSMDAIIGWSVADRLSEIRCPTLVISAEDDYLPRALKWALAEGIQNASWLQVEDCHHGLPAEKPQIFNRVVLDFLDSGD